MRNFLLTTSILQQITPEVAERLAGVHDGRRELSRLEQSGLFTNRLDDERYRYHNLFREFLERRLVDDRSDAEVLGLHIHAASYFETTEKWPEAIHHYLRAGLMRQAARLIAKHGESIAITGRLGLIDEWLRQLPSDTVKQNARLSLLSGEASGIRGDWQGAVDSLSRARSYFARKGDKRLEALACLKLSSVYSNYGDGEAAAAVAESGLNLAPPDATSTRLRLQGNLAITRGRLAGSLDAVVHECKRLASEAEQQGLEHFAAIGYHNAGEILLAMGEIRPAIDSLARAAQFWAETPTTPFGHSEDLVAALIADRQLGQARVVALEAIRRTGPWERPWALSQRAFGDLLAAEGNFGEAASAIGLAIKNRDPLGNAYPIVASGLVEVLFLAGAPASEIRPTVDGIERVDQRVDQRHSSDLIPAQAIACHVLRECEGQCQSFLANLEQVDISGAVFQSSTCRVKVGALAFDHRPIGPKRRAWEALGHAVRNGWLPSVRWWARHYAADAEIALRMPDGAAVLAALMTADPDGWRNALLQVLPLARGPERERLLSTVAKHATRTSLEALREIPGQDVRETYRQLRHTQAHRLFVRTLGGVSVHRGGWDGPVMPLEKRRVRGLLAVLAAHSKMSLTRDAAVDLLWPDADGDSAVNSLNQTVFQLRRHLDPGYRQGDSPEYVINSAEQLKLADDLIRTDIDEVRSLPRRIAGVPWARRQEIASRTIALVRGEFLSDLRYETWTSGLQASAYRDIRASLLPIAMEATSFDIGVAIDAATALITLDPFDEAATQALAENLARSGRRRAAKDVLIRYAELLNEDADEPATPRLDEHRARG